MGFLTREEIKAILDSCRTDSKSDQRDLLFFTLLYNTGARVFGSYRSEGQRRK